MPQKILIAFGTRPEAIKMCPLVKQMQNTIGIDVKVCVTGQHREMLDSVLAFFEVKPDFDLDVMSKSQTLSGLTSKILNGFEQITEIYKPDLVVVHGDTATTLAISIAAYFHKIKIAHVEAGLRTGNLYSPWPEEGNRKVVGALADYHFAPTAISSNNLLLENISKDKIVITGNTVVDALIVAENKIKHSPELMTHLDTQFAFLDERKILLVTGHRRENFGQGFKNICKALLEIAQEHRDDLQIVYPVHLNPNVRDTVNELLKNETSIHLIDPLDYVPFVYLMMRCHIILTDSGGVQEEGPSLGKPILVMRDTTERPEAIKAGTVKLVGTDIDTIVTEIRNLMKNKSSYETMSRANNPYGDGTACSRIIEFIKTL